MEGIVIRILTAIRNLLARFVPKSYANTAVGILVATIGILAFCVFIFELIKLIR